MITRVRKSLRARLMVYMMAISAMGTVLTSLLVYAQTRGQLQDEVYLRLEASASLQQQALERWMDDQMIFIKWLVANEDFLNPIIRMLETHEDPEAYAENRTKFLNQLDC